MMMMQREKGLAVASLVFALCVASAASAQKGYSARVGIEPWHSERTLAPRSSFSRDTADSPPTSDASAEKYPLIGALIGAGVGFTAAFVVTHQAHVADHSEDALAYVAFVPFGAATGFVIGLVAYLVRRH
jgi:hypothetical protein